MSRFECGHMLPKMHECSVCLRAEIERLRAECVVMDRAVLRMHEGRATAAAFEEAAKWHEQEAKLWSSPSAERHAESAKHFRAKAKAKGSEVRGK